MDSNSFGKCCTVMLEIGSPITWIPRFEHDPDTQLRRILWLFMAISFLPIGYVEHRFILLKAAYEKGIKEKENG